MPTQTITYQPKLSLSLPEISAPVEYRNFLDQLTEIDRIIKSSKIDMRMACQCQF